MAQPSPFLVTPAPSQQFLLSPNFGFHQNPPLREGFSIPLWIFMGFFCDFFGIFAR
jgi:hypothetical protein